MSCEALDLKSNPSKAVTTHLERLKHGQANPSILNQVLPISLGKSGEFNYHSRAKEL